MAALAYNYDLHKMTNNRTEVNAKDDEFGRSLGDRLKMLRGRESQASFAAKLGVSGNTYAFYERGERMPGADTIQRVAEVTGTDPAALLGLKPFEEVDRVRLFTGRDKEIGARLAAIRGAESVPDFANRLGVRMGTVRMYEAGDAPPDVDYLIRIAQATGADLNALLGVAARRGESPVAVTGQQEDADYEGRKPPGISDVTLLAECLEALEEREQYRRLAPAKKARAAAALYELCSLGEEKPADIVKRGAA